MVGYHGTTECSAKAIIETKKFIPSTKDTEWLGEGIYFFKHSTHAEFWAKREVEKVKNKGKFPAVLRVRLECDDAQFFDLDDPKNLYELNDFLRRYFKRIGNQRYVKFKKSEYEKKLCFGCNIYRRLNNNIAIISYTFSDIKKRCFSGFRTNQTQLCVSVGKEYAIKEIEKWSEQV